jgi:heme exporter protein D
MVIVLAAPTSWIIKILGAAFTKKRSLLSKVTQKWRREAGQSQATSSSTGFVFF